MLAKACNIATWVCEALNEAPADRLVIEVESGEGSLHFLQKVYRSAQQPMARRIRCAIEALPFEQPKLCAVAMGTMTNADFAASLIGQSNAAKRRSRC